jgi:hypothetical protein
MPVTCHRTQPNNPKLFAIRRQLPLLKTAASRRAIRLSRDGPSCYCQVQLKVLFPLCIPHIPQFPHGTSNSIYSSSFYSVKAAKPNARYTWSDACDLLLEVECASSWGSTYGAVEMAMASEQLHCHWTKHIGTLPNLHVCVLSKCMKSKRDTQMKNNEGRKEITEGSTKAELR